MIIGVDHIAIAVSDLTLAIERFTNDLGFSLNAVEDVVGAQTSTAFLNQTLTRIELIHPLEGQGPVQKFIETRKGKGGLHHICFRSDNLISDIQTLKQKGYEFIQDTPQPGAHNSQVVWLHPKSFDGLLIELAQYDH